SSACGLTSGTKVPRRLRQPPVSLALMGRKRPAWADKPEFAWMPEPPLRFEPHASPEFAAAPEPAPSPPPHEHNHTLPTPRWLQRLMIAAAQSLCLAAVFLGGGPGTGLMAGAVMALLLAPLLPMQGLGQIPARRLLTWTAGVTAFLFGVG